MTSSLQHDPHGISTHALREEGDRGTSYAEAYEDMKPYLCSRLILWNGNRTFKDFRSMVLDCTSTIFLSLADAMERMREVFREVGNALREVNT